jgi:glycosyltransferase involved in cell wall biosynthesis
MKKVLIISWKFPPDPDVGGLRIHGLAKYLSEFDWEAMILTTILPSNPDAEFRVIQTPYYDVIASWKKRFGLKPEEGVKKKYGITSHKNKKSLVDFILNFLSEIIAYPDAQKGWYKYAVKAGSEILENEDIDAIISSSSPVTCHLIANELKNKYKIPWIADLRDLWTQNHYYQYSPIRKFIERRLEIRTLSKADSLVTVSKDLAETLRTLHKEKRIYTIRNGFDPQEVNILHGDLTNKFAITYTGILYQGKRDPSKLFKAIQDLNSEGKINPNDVEVRFYGPKEDWMEKEIEGYGLQDIVNDYGVISRDFALEKQRETQVLLLLLWDHPEEIGVYTGKVFEYLAAQRPILAIGGPKGVVKDLLAETNSGMYATSVDDVKKALEEYYKEYKRKGNIEYKGERTKNDKYSQKEMARRFAEVLDTLTRK